MTLENLNIYSFLDYRQFLDEFCRQALKKSKRFSFRWFAQKADVKAPNFLQWLIQGKRNLSKKTIPRLARALGLAGSQAEYFKNLVLFNQARTLEEKTRYFNVLSGLRKPMDFTLLTEAQFDHYKNWHNNAVRELLRYYKFDENEKWAYRKLARMVAPQISESEAKKAVENLVRLGMAKRDPQGRITQADRIVSTGDEVQSFFIRKFHESMIGLAKEAVDRFPREHRDISSITMSVSDQGAALIKKEIQQFRKRIMELVRLDGRPNQVRQLNFQFFPLTNMKQRNNHHNEV